MEPLPLLSTSLPSVRRHRGSRGHDPQIGRGLVDERRIFARDDRTFAEMLVGPSKSLELLRLRRSFSFQRASMSAAGQNIVLSVASFGTAGAAPPAPRCPPWA